MSAPKRTTPPSIRQALQRHSGIRWELDRLEKAANKQIRKTWPSFRYNGDVRKTLLEDLAEVVSSKDWRRPLLRSADRLRDAAKHIRKAVRSATQAANGSLTYALIPSIVRESTSEARAERKRIAALPPGEMLFGIRGAIASLRKREGQAVVNLKVIAPNFLKAMLIYAAQYDREAARLERIVMVKDRRYDRLGPILKLIHDVQNLTGKPNDDRISRLLADASEAAGSDKIYSADAIRKIREHHLSAPRKS